jgi:PleD family two-component response regulator
VSPRDLLKTVVSSKSAGNRQETGSGLWHARGMPAAARPSARPGEPATSRTALVVDDEDNISYLVASALRLAGLEVRTAGTAMEALADAAAYPPDAVVLDVMLPDLDGFEVLKRLRGRGIDAPVLFLSARGRRPTGCAG